MTINLNLDSKYSALIDGLTVLNQKLTTFITGDETKTIQTDSGAIKSLAGLSADLKKIKYIQKVIDHRLYSDMVADSVLVDGDVVRVWGDTNNVNALYLKSGATYTKIAYRDVYDLGSMLPYPLDNLRVTASEAATGSTLPLVKFVLPVSTVNVTDQVLRGSYKYTSQNVGLKGTISQDFTIVISAGDQNIYSAKVVKSNRISASLDVALDSVTFEDLSVTYTSDLLNHYFTVSFVPPVNASLNVAGKLDFQIRGVDTDIVTTV